MVSLPVVIVLNVKTLVTSSSVKPIISDIALSDYYDFIVHGVSY